MSTEVTGKPAGDDLREGKRTLLMSLGMADPARADLLRSALGDEDLTPETLADVRQALVDSGAVAEVERRIDALTETALAALDRADLDAPADRVLADLAVAAGRRSS